MIEDYQLITPSRDSQCSTDRQIDFEYYHKELQVDVEEYSTLQKPKKFLQNITYSPTINSKKSSQGDFNDTTVQHMSPVRVFDTQPLSMVTSSFGHTKNLSPVSSTRKSGSPSMSPKKRGKRRLKENMENLDPIYDMSNFNSNNSKSSKLLDGNLLSSSSSIYNVAQSKTQTHDSQSNLMSATPSQSQNCFDYQEDHLGDQDQSNDNRQLNISPSKFDRFVNLDPTVFQNPYMIARKSNQLSITEMPESKFDLSVVKEASACLEASSIGTKQYNSKTAGAGGKGNVKDKRTKSFVKKAERVKEIQVGSFSSQSQARAIAKSVTQSKPTPQSAQPRNPFDNLMKRTEKIKEKSNLRKSQEKLEKYVQSNKGSPDEAPQKRVPYKSPQKSPQKNSKKGLKSHESSTSLKNDKQAAKVEKIKTPQDSGTKQRRQKSDRKKSNLKSGRKNDSIISATGIAPVTARIDKDDSQIQQAIFQPQIISQQNVPTVQIVDDEVPNYNFDIKSKKSITISEIQNQAMQLAQYEQELKHNLDNMHIPTIPNNSIQSQTSNGTQKILKMYTQILEDVQLPYFDQQLQQSLEINNGQGSRQQFQLQCQSVISEYQSNYFTNQQGETPLSNGRLETNQSCMLDHQNYYEDEIAKMQQDLEEFKQSEQDILTYNTLTKMTPRNTQNEDMSTPRNVETPAHLQSYADAPQHLMSYQEGSIQDQNANPSPVKSLKQIISLIPGRREEPQTKNELMANLEEAQNYLDESSDGMSDQIHFLKSTNQVNLSSFTIR